MPSQTAMPNATRTNKGQLSHRKLAAGRYKRVRKGSGSAQAVKWRLRVVRHARWLRRRYTWVGGGKGYRVGGVEERREAAEKNGTHTRTMGRRHSKLRRLLQAQEEQMAGVALAARLAAKGMAHQACWVGGQAEEGFVPNPILHLPTCLSVLSHPVCPPVCLSVLSVGKGRQAGGRGYSVGMSAAG